MDVADTVRTDRKGPDLDHDPRPNGITLAAAQEARDIMSGKIKGKWQHPSVTKEEFKAQLEKTGQEI
jgi:hypothetical protein